jgi:hypothetical protein
MNGIGGNNARQERQAREDPQVTYQQIHSHKPLFGKKGKLMNLGHLDFEFVP